MDSIEEWSANARSTLASVRALLSDGGLTVTEVSDVIFGVGFGVPIQGNDYSLVSVMASGPTCNVVNLTVGVLKDVEQNRLAVLEQCNELTRDNAAYPFFLHDAEVGWDVISQVRMPIDLVMSVPGYFLSLVRGLPELARQGRSKLTQVVDGQPYTWTAEDCHRLLIRSLL